MPHRFLHLVFVIGEHNRPVLVLVPLTHNAANEVGDEGSVHVLQNVLSLFAEDAHRLAKVAELHEENTHML
jgi:hypothetical protein